MTRLEKRLLACMQLGVCISYADGHRWLVCSDSIADFNLEDEYQIKNGRSLNTKVYGDLESALDRVDWALERVGRSILEHYFDSCEMEKEAAFDTRFVYRATVKEPTPEQEQDWSSYGNGGGG